MAINLKLPLNENLLIVPGIKLATSSAGIRDKNQKDLIERLKKIALERNVKTVVIGYPLNMNYKENSMTEIIDKFKVVMESNDFEIYLEDERLSSQYAKKIMIQQDIKTGKNKEMVDVLSASIILQTYLDRKK